MMTSGTTTRDALAVLAWMRAMGADAAVAAESIDWRGRRDSPPGGGFAMPGRPEPAPAGPQAPAARGGMPTPPPSSQGGLRVGPSVAAPEHSMPPFAPAPPRPPTVAPATRPFPSALPDAAQLAAREAASKAASLEELEQALKAFDGCALKATAKNLCFYRGAAKARLLIIGEAPGREEDLEGKPFVGRAGQMLEKMLAAAGISSAEVHVTNVVYWRPPGNRTPTPQEAQVCRPFLERQIELVGPRIVMPLGGSAMKQILDAPEGIMRLRGKWHDIAIGSHACRVIPSLHPAYLLRTPIAKRPAWRDFLAVAEALDRAAG